MKSVASWLDKTLIDWINLVNNVFRYFNEFWMTWCRCKYLNLLQQKTWGSPQSLRLHRMLTAMRKPPVSQTLSYANDNQEAPSLSDSESQTLSYANSFETVQKHIQHTYPSLKGNCMSTPTSIHRYTIHRYSILSYYNHQNTKERFTSEFLNKRLTRTDSESKSQINHHHYHHLWTISMTK